jgi:4'-phosphopantetheinyl transferase
MSIIKKDFVSVYALNIGQKLEVEVYDELLRMVGKGKRDRILAFRRWQDAHLALFGDLIVRMLLIKQGIANNDGIHFLISDYGKPVVQGLPDFHFNVSHSGEWVVCAVADQAVGIDVEKIAAIDLSIADSFFCIKERDDIFNSSDPGVRFFDYWTLKESYIKFIGHGLSIPLNEFCIAFPGDNKVNVEIGDKVVDAVYLKQYQFAPGYKMGVCSSAEHFSDTYTIFSLEDVVSVMKG